MRAWIGEDRGGVAFEQCGHRDRSDPVEHAVAEEATFRAESEAGDPPVHGGRAEPVGFVRLQTGAGETGRQAVAALGDWRAALRLYSTGCSGPWAALQIFARGRVGRGNFRDAAAPPRSSG